MGIKLQELQNRINKQMDNDEPVFPLLGRDPKAPQLVREWAYQREHDINEGRRPATDLIQVAEARECADRMERWREENDGAWREGLFGNS